MPTAINVGRPSPKRGSWNVQHYKVTAAQTFVVGDWVYLDSAGTLAIAAAASADVGAIKLLGRAKANAADILALPTDQAYCPVDVPGHDGQFVVAVYHSTGASAVYAATDIDAAATTVTVPLRNQSSQWVANRENNGTNDAVVIVERHPQYAYSTQYGWFWAQVIDSVRHDNAS